MTRPSPTTDRLRHEIDCGRTRDKINHPDPAAAPLGTDEEAAGTPASAEAVRMAMQHEVDTDGRTAQPDRGVRIFLAAVLLLILLTLAVGWAIAMIASTDPQ